MATLILNAGTASPISLVVTTAGESAPTEIGTVTQSFNGADRSSVRGTKRNFGAMTTFVDTPTKEAILSILRNGSQLPCSGDLLGNIQTQCTIRYTGANMIPGLPGYWRVGLSGNEVQGSVVLLRYAPGDLITGESFTRSTTAYQVNAAGTPVSIAINTKRDGHYINGVQSFLLEGAATNSVLRGNDFTNAAWTKVNLTPTNGTSDPAGGTNACTLTATAGSAQAFQNLGAGSSIARANSCWIRRRTGTGVVQLTNPLDVPTTVTLTSSWQRFTAIGGASTLRFFDIVIATSGDAIDVWCPQMDDSAYATSEIPTTTIAVTRGADIYSLPFTTPPQEMTAYVKFVEKGTGVGGFRLFSITNSANASPQFSVFGSASVYSPYHSNGTTTVTAALGGAVALGDVVELAPRLFSDGSVDIVQSLNGAASSSATQSASNAMASAWIGLLAWLNSAGNTGQGYIALQSFKICAGARSLAECRAL